MAVIDTQIEVFCKELQMPTLMKEYHQLGNRAAKENWKYTEYLYEALKLEAEGKAARTDQDGRLSHHQDTGAV